MVSHCVLTTIIAQPDPLFPAPALNKGSSDSTSDSPRLWRHQPCPRNKAAQEMTLEKASYANMSIGSKHILKPKKRWNIWLLKEAVLLAPTTEYLGIWPRRICVCVFLSSIIIFFYPIMSGEEHFPGYISSLIHFKSVKERSGHSSPHKGNSGGR